MRRLTDDTPVRRIEILGPEECRDVVERLDGLEGEWRRRGDAFFTLGAATYLDVCGGGSYGNYRKRAEHDNRLLVEAFGDLLVAVRDAVADLVGGRCEYAPELARPGFHVFLARSLHATLRDGFHLDLQFRDLPVPATAYTATLTFTLPVELPLAGGGIEFCRLDAGDKRGRVSAEWYRLGELLVHSGRTLHRRAEVPSSPRCRRITLQGHALCVEGDKWILYW